VGSHVGSDDLELAMKGGTREVTFYGRSTT